MPTPAALPFAKLLAQLASSLDPEQVAGIEPVKSNGVSQHRGKVAREVGYLRTAPVPKRPAIGHAVEREDFLHTPVAIGRHDEDGAAWNADDDVVVEFALRPVIEKIEMPISHT